jgi:hypothetical protein
MVSLEVRLLSTDAQRLPHRDHRPHRWMLWLVVSLLVPAGIAAGIDRAFFAGESRAARPELQQILDRLVQTGDVPGATAYVAAPDGTWLGAAGVADLSTGTAMRRPDADREQQQDMADGRDPAAGPGGGSFPSTTRSRGGCPACCARTAIRSRSAS